MKIPKFHKKFTGLKNSSRLTSLKTGYSYTRISQTFYTNPRLKVKQNKGCCENFEKFPQN